MRKTPLEGAEGRSRRLEALGDASVGGERGCAQTGPFVFIKPSSQLPARPERPFAIIEHPPLPVPLGGRYKKRIGTPPKNVPAELCDTYLK